MTAIRSCEVHPFYFIYRESMYFILLLLNIFLFWKRLKKKKIVNLISSHFNILKRVHKLTTITGNCITVIDIEAVTTVLTKYCTI